jgi:hypothetical protein
MLPSRRLALAIGVGRQGVVVAHGSPVLEKKKKRKKDAVGRELQWTQGYILRKLMSGRDRRLHFRRFGAPRRRLPLRRVPFARFLWSNSTPIGPGSLPGGPVGKRADAWRDRAASVETQTCRIFASVRRWSRVQTHFRSRGRKRSLSVRLRRAAGDALTNRLGSGFDPDWYVWDANFEDLSSGSNLSSTYKFNVWSGHFPSI